MFPFVYMEEDPLEEQFNYSEETESDDETLMEYYPLASSSDTWLPYFFAVCFVFVKVTESLQMLSNVWNNIIHLLTRLFRRNEPGIFFPNWARVATVTTTENNGHHHSIYRYGKVLVNQLTENYVYLNPDRMTVCKVMATHPSLMIPDRGLLTIKLREKRYLRVMSGSTGMKDSHINDVIENDDEVINDVKENDDNITYKITEKSDELESSNTSFLAVEYRHTATMKSLRTYSMHIPVEEMYVGNHILSKEYIASYFAHKNWWSRPPFAMEISHDDGLEEYTVYVMDSNLTVAHLGPHQYLEIQKDGYQICNR